jgi:hypothetical protein
VNTVRVSSDFRFKDQVATTSFCEPCLPFRWLSNRLQKNFPYKISNFSLFGQTLGGGDDAMI